MSRLFILGAGASKGYNQSPTKQSPPLANEIIKTFHKLEISENRLVLIGDIVNYARDNKGIASEYFYSWDDDIERVLTDIDEKIQDISASLQKNVNNRELLSDSLRYTRAYDQFLFLFASIMNEIQNGPISSAYDLFSKKLNSSDTIITFNWDTLLDRALEKNHNWDPYNGYGLTAEAVYDDEWKSSSVKQSKQGIQYLKLHGSTNWLVPYHQMNLSTGKPYSLNNYGMDKLYVFYKATKPYKTYANRNWGTYEPFSYCYYPPDLPLIAESSRAGYTRISLTIAPGLPENNKVETDDENVYSMPLIIPPVRDKKYFRYGEIFNTIWEKASASMSNCEKLYIIGYSLPDTDLLIRECLKTNLTQNNNLSEIVIINPNSNSIKEILTSKLQLKAEIIESHNEYFDEETIQSLL